VNLHGVVQGNITAVNPTVPVGLRVSTGQEATSPDGKRVPLFATPGEFTGTIAGGILTVTAVGAGRLLRGQALAGETVAAGTTILGQISGNAGGVGVYSVSGSQVVAEELMTTSLAVPAQIQALTFRDITQIESLNLQGTRRAIYFYGAVDGLVRPGGKGGDLATFPDGSVWLVAIVLESWPDWCKVAATLQNNG
jgi:hypothetical protein